MTHDHRKVLSDNLKYYLERGGTTPSEFCRVHSIPYTTFMGWYNGKNYPASDKLQMLADSLEIQKSDLTEKMGSGIYTFSREDYSIAQDICDDKKLKKIFSILNCKSEKELDALLILLTPSAN